ESWTCCSWRNGVFTTDGSTIDLYGETFLDWKSNYSLKCQLVIMPHNLTIIAYALGQLGSMHDSYALQGTHIVQDHATLLPPVHCMWADTAYPTERWCVMLFKKPRGGNLNCKQNTYNQYVSKVHT
ncbi:hypothetical protein PAXRUDRAFT_149532, partial [Paxillus rubicundulus Ve08.2h10]